MLLVRRIVDDYPEIYLDELGHWMHYINGVWYSITTLHRCIRQCGLTMKKVMQQTIPTNL